MKKIKEVATLLLVLVLLLCTISSTAIANDSNRNSDVSNNTEEVVAFCILVFSEHGNQHVFYNYEDYEEYLEATPSRGIPNAVRVRLVKIDSNNVKFVVENIGIDTLDGFQGRVTVYANGLAQVSRWIEELNILPMATRTTSLYCLNWASATGSNMYAWDGPDSGTISSIVLYS